MKLKTMGITRSHMQPFILKLAEICQVLKCCSECWDSKETGKKEAQAQLSSEHLAMSNTLGGEGGGKTS
jgi:hypothetical protein